MRIFVIESLTKPTSNDHADHRRFFCSSLFGACFTGSNIAGFKSTIMNILVTNFGDSGTDVMIFTESMTPDEVETKLTLKGEYYCECYEVPTNELEYYCYEPCWIK